MLVIDVIQQFTAVQADLLDGTDLETFPGTGVMLVRAASTVTTATLAGRVVGGDNARGPQPIAKDSGPRTSTQDRVLLLRGVAGQKAVVDLAGTTGTVKVDVTYMGGRG